MTTTDTDRLYDAMDKLQGTVNQLNLTLVAHIAKEDERWAGFIDEQTKSKAWTRDLWKCVVTSVLAAGLSLLTYHFTGTTTPPSTPIAVTETSQNQ